MWPARVLMSLAASPSQVVPSPDGSRGQVLQQKAVGYPVIWLRDDVLPYAQAGDAQWAATNASVEVALPAATAEATGGGGAAFLAVRLDGSTTSATGA